MAFKQLQYLSFADPDRPRGQQFLGACIVPGVDIEEALGTARFLGCNPGGQVLGIAIQPGREPSGKFIGRLLTKDEVSEAFETPALTLAEAQEQGLVMPEHDQVCKDCNDGA